MLSRRGRDRLASAGPVRVAALLAHPDVDDTTPRTADVHAYIGDEVTSPAVQAALRDAPAALRRDARRHRAG